AGRNEPTEAGVEGAKKILEIVGQLGPRDVSPCLLSGGGSALLPLPVEPVPPAEKPALTNAPSAAEANTDQINPGRKQLRPIKGGGLARACTAGQLITLITSDVIGDPLETIASGPTVADSGTPSEALSVLEQLGIPRDTAPRAFAYLEQQAAQPSAPLPIRTQVHHEVIGNNAVAVDAAGMEAERRGYSHAMHVADEFEGAAEEVG